MNYDLNSISGRLSSVEGNISFIEKMTEDRQTMIERIKINVDKTNEHVKDLKLKIRLMSEQINELERENEEFKKENETMREQLTHCEQEELLKIIEELTAKNNKLENELHIDPTRNHLIHSRNERIVKLLCEAFKYINDPSLMSPGGMFK